MHMKMANLLALKRMSFKQIYCRLLKILKYKLIYKISNNAKYTKNIFCRTDVLWGINILDMKDYISFIKENERISSGLIIEAENIINNKYIFLNKERLISEVSFPLADDEADVLWKYYLNYFDYGITLLKAYLLTDKKEYIHKLILLMEKWINNTRPGQKISWESYPLSRRLVNWIIICHFLKFYNLVDEEKLLKLLNSIGNQAEFLYNNMEQDIRNNHLTSDAKALVFAGISMPSCNEAKRWLNKGNKVLKERILEEVRDDGTQYENSTSYQMITILDYLETLWILSDADNDLEKMLKSTLKKMFDALAKMMKPDLELPLLNDSVFGYPIKPVELMAAGAVLLENPVLKYFSENATLEYLLWMFGRRGYEAYIRIEKKPPEFNSIVLKDAKLAFLRSGWAKSDSYVAFDCGDLGPMHCPGHGHADTLSFEFYCNGTPIIVEPGVYSYHDDKYRYYFKSTKSHNTITVDHKDQSEIIGAFRVGKMAKGKLLSWDFSREKDVVTGLHNGYEGIIHKRTMEYYKKNKLVIIDEISGSGKHTLDFGLNFSNVAYDFKLWENNLQFKINSLDIKISVYGESKSVSTELQDSFISREWNLLLANKKLLHRVIDFLPLKLLTVIEVL